MGDIWKADQKTVAMVDQRIDAAFPHLTELKKGKIAVLFHEKAREKHGVVEYGTIKKAPPLLALLTDKTFTYEFLISLAADRWNNNLDDAQRMAEIDHLLCAVAEVTNSTTNDVKYELRPPEIVAYAREIELHGIWWPDSNTIEQMFAKWLGPVGSTTPTTRGPGIAPPVFAQPTPAAPTIKLPPKKGGVAAKQKPRDKDGDLDGDDLDLPFVDDGPMSN